MTEEAQLLHRYVAERSEAAFTELVHRHINLVYFAALRRVGGDAHLADDVTQSVFTDLARKAPTLKDRAALAGWLHTSTRFAAAQVVRAERRRRIREEKAHHLMHEESPTTAPDWNQLRPVIDDALDALNEPEREVLLLRFFENLPFAAIGAQFSLTPDAARMRTERALEKLRALLAQRGIASTAAALALAFATQSGLAAPAGLATRVATGALATAGAATTATLGLWKLLAGGAVAAFGVGLMLHQFHDPAPFPVGASDGAPVQVNDGPATPSATSAQVEAVVAVPDVESAPVVALAAPVSAADSFSRLSEMQQDILKKLWEHQKISPDHPPLHWGFRPSENSPDLMAFEMAVANLATRGWVGSAPKLGLVFLTPQGAGYCAATSAEIDAHPAKAPLFRDAPATDGTADASVASSEFAGLLGAQKDILKTLWEHQKLFPHQPWSYRPGPTNPNLAAFEDAAAGLKPSGLINVTGPIGAVSLTAKGAEFCLAHAAELDAYPLKRQSFRAQSKN
jgi:RNA polymerase sigma factor (sigma-70 family)